VLNQSVTMAGDLPDKAASRLTDRAGGRAWPIGLLCVPLLAAFLGGCAYSLSEFASPLDRTAQTASLPATADGAAMPLKEAVLVQDEPAAPPTKPTALVAPDTYPNLNVPPGQPTAKLLSPEEKAKTIAELEALAHSQGAATSKVREEARIACEKALAALDPAERRKRVEAGWKC
jgi:hypothetical protein